MSLKPTQAYETPSSGWFGGSSDVGSRVEKKLGEPYRLYNLDVFEYLDESPFGLYGSIPIMTAHGVSNGVAKTSGVYFHNPSEMYVDVNVDGSNGVHTKWMAESGAMDVFFLPGATPDRVASVHRVDGHDVDAADVRPGLPPVPMELPRRKRRQGSG